MPSDWGDGYDNVLIGCTVENQDRANYRLPIFLDLPIKHRSIIASPLLERLDLRPYLDEDREFEPAADLPGAGEPTIQESIYYITAFDTEAMPEE